MKDSAPVGPGGELTDRGRIGIILLAAGSSSRMGQSKQKLLIDEKPLLVHSVETALKSDADKVIVVLGSEESVYRKILNQLSVDIIFNPRWQSGMGSSLKAGMSHVISIKPQTTAVIVMVCDQPLLTSKHVNALIKKYRDTGANLVASSYSDTTGVPALFGHALFDEILNLDDEHGAKKIIQKHRHESVNFPEGRIDLDTPEDYQSFIQGSTKKIS